jgi:two-component system, chemotaxis family, CheB/CheR fusion protein
MADSATKTEDLPAVTAPASSSDAPSTGPREPAEVSRHELEDFLENATVGLHWVAADGTILWANRAELEMLGYSRDEYIGRHIADFHVDQPVIDDILKRLTCRETLRAYEARLRCKDGTIKHVLIDSSVMFDQDKFIHTRCFTRDNTDRHRAEEALRHSESRFRSLIEQSPLSTQIYSPDGQPLQSNKAWERLFGVTMADIKGYNILSDPELEKHGVLELIRRGFAGEVVHIPPIPYVPDRGMYKGQERWTGATLYPVKDQHGAIREIVLIHEDITERKRTEMALQRAKEEAEAANHAKDQFLAVLSHELRTPLTPVLAAVWALETQSDLPRAVRADLEMIRRNVELETRLIDDLLDLTRITKGKLQLNLEAIDLREAINRVVEICNEDIVAKELLLMVDLPARGCYARADSARLQQVLWNLIKNAVKFTPPGGKITIRASCDHTFVAVSVSDTGVGIEPQSMPRIFRPFEQGTWETRHQFGGLGLGLTISKALTELHGGTLEVHSAGKDQGTTFTVRIPATRPPRTSPTEDDAAPAQTTSDPQPWRILLVEDHPDTARIMLRLLRADHHDVEWAGNIESALRAAAENPFDVVVSDLGLPDGSGLELMRQLRSKYGLKGIALSGYGMEEDLRKSKEAGFVEHLTKPINFQSLREKIQAVMSTSTT